MQVVVIGAGITGLAIAWSLRRRGDSVTVLESAPRVGGAVTSIRENGYLAELGPGSIMESATIATLIADLGLSVERVTPSPAARRRYVVRRGAPVAVPMSPPALIRSRLLSVSGKLRLLAEPFVRRGTDANETVAAFARRRLGAEALDYLVNPMVAGIYAGDPARLAARHACASLVAMERRYGSLIAGAVRGPRAPRQLISFRDGLGALPQTLATQLGDTVRRDTPVRAIEPNGHRWTVRAEHATFDADTVVFTTSATVLGRLSLPPVLAATLRPVTTMRASSVVTLSLGFKRHEVRHPLDGFGVLVPAVEPSSLLGVLFASSLFPDRAPADHVLLTCFIGGTRSPALVHEPDDALVERALVDLRRLLGVTGAPTFVRLTRWPAAIPQYDVGHERVTGAIERAERSWPGLHFAGSYRDGVSIPDRIAAALALVPSQHAP